MKKKEAIEIATKVSKVIMEYIELILTDSIKVKGKIEFIPGRVEGYQEKMSMVIISVPEKNFHKEINSGIPAMHSIVFYTKILEDLVDYFLESESLCVGRFYHVNGMMGPSFHGLKADSISGNCIHINFPQIGTELNDAIGIYNSKIEEFKNKINEEKKKTNENTLESKKVK